MWCGDGRQGRTYNSSQKITTASAATACASPISWLSMSTPVLLQQRLWLFSMDYERWSAAPSAPTTHVPGKKKRGGPFLSSHIQRVWAKISVSVKATTDCKKALRRSLELKKVFFKHPQLTTMLRKVPVSWAFKTMHHWLQTHSQLSEFLQDFAQ